VIPIGILLSLVFILDIICGICVVAAFPILCLTELTRVACCMFGTGLAVHTVIHWFFDSSVVSVAEEMLDKHEEDDDE